MYTFKTYLYIILIDYILHYPMDGIHQLQYPLRNIDFL
jgi:hypothetical protein